MLPLQKVLIILYSILILFQLEICCGQRSLVYSQGNIQLNSFNPDASLVRNQKWTLASEYWDYWKFFWIFCGVGGTWGKCKLNVAFKGVWVWNEPWNVHIVMFYCIFLDLTYPKSTTKTIFLVKWNIFIFIRSHKMSSRKKYPISYQWTANQKNRPEKETR